MALTIGISTTPIHSLLITAVQLQDSHLDEDYEVANFFGGYEVRPDGCDPMGQSTCPPFSM
jgi:hypothetical protein